MALEDALVIQQIIGLTAQVHAFAIVKVATDLIIMEVVY